MSRRCGSSKPTPTLLTVWLWSQARKTRPAVDATCEVRKAVERIVDPTTRQKSPIKNLPCAAGVAGGGRERSRTCRMPPVWRGGAEGSRTCRMPSAWRGGAGKALRQTNHRKVTISRRALVDMEGDTNANRREKSCEKPPAGHRQGGGLECTRYGKNRNQDTVCVGGGVTSVFLFFFFWSGLGSPTRASGAPCSVAASSLETVLL